MGLVNWWTLNGTLNDCKNGNALVAGSDFNSNGAGKIGNCYYASTTSAYAQSANTIMIDGNGYTWTNEKSESTLGYLPGYTDGTTLNLSSTKNGYAIIKRVPTE